MSALSPFFFWIDQEPVESEAELFLPADTPVHRPSPKVLHQIQKIEQKRLVRESKRLKTAHFERLKAIKHEQAAQVDKSKLPPVINAPNKIDLISGTDFINRNQSQIVELLELARSIKSDPSSMTIEQIPKNDEKDEEEAVLNSKREMSSKLDYQKQIEEKWLSDVKSMEDELDLLSAHLSKVEHRQIKQTVGKEDPSSLQISHIPPLPPRVSRQDPRTFLPEYRAHS